jgi:hypothetical protein
VKKFSNAVEDAVKQWSVSEARGHDVAWLRSTITTHSPEPEEAGYWMRSESPTTTSPYADGTIEKSMITVQIQA